MNATDSKRISDPSIPIRHWDQFLESERPDIGYKQFLWWAEFERKRGWDSFGVVARDGDTICGGANVFVKSFAPGKSFYYIPHGPVLPRDDQDAAELFQNVVEYIDDCRQSTPDVVSHLRIEPRWQHRPEFSHAFRESSDWHEPRDTLLVDLRLSADAILGQMRKKGRYNIRVAQRHGVSVVEDTSAQGLADFIRLYKATIQRQDIRSRSTKFFKALAESLFSDGRASLFFAEYQGSRLATALVLYSGDTATYKYGGSTTTNRNVMAPYLLHFEIMLKAKSLGHTQYDFYGVSPKDIPDDPWANFSAFKRKFGGDERSFIPALDLVYDSVAYEEFQMWRRS